LPIIMSEGPFAELFRSCREEGRAALLPYMTAGLPTPADSVGLFVAMAEAGADGFEVGIPYADPLMDGPTIQAAGERALAAGSGVAVGLGILGDVVANTGKPAVVMTYVNPILRMGIDAFAKRVADAGAAGVIVADLPVDEAGAFADVFRSHDVGLVLFAAPTTTEARLARVVAAAPPFVYGIADLGVTGERQSASAHVSGLVARIRRFGDIPVVVGVGISTPEQARLAAAEADGVIVGSALVRRVLDAVDAAAAQTELRSAVAELAAAMKRAPAD
jgi:tryptophan synthase alpha chain